MIINEDLLLNNGEYDIVYTDPAWNQTKGNKRKCRPNQNKELDYKTMSVDDIKNVHENVSKLCNNNHNIFMWTIDKYLHETEKMMKELGYELHARFIWDKENGVAPAFTVRFSHEYLLWFYKKGHMLMPDLDVRGKYTTVLREKSSTHSKKPECAYQMIEAMFPESRKIELFARSLRKNWDSWGNQVGILDQNLYRLEAIITNKDDIISFSFMGDTIDDVKEQGNIKLCVEHACKIFNISSGNLFLNYNIEFNGDYVDCDEYFVSIENQKIINWV